MADNIIIKITTEADLDAAQKQLKDLESTAYDLTKQMGDLKKAEAEEIKALEAKIKKSQEVIASHKKYIEENKLAAKAAEQFNQKIADEEKKIEDANKAIDAARKKYKDLIMTKKDEIKVNQQSIKDYTKQINSYKQLTGQSGRMVIQLRAMREELQRMEDAGEFGSKAFVDLAMAAARLEDQVGDTQQRIRILSSDTLALDTIMGAADGLTGTFYVATSAAEMFGSDMEALQQAFYKVQAAMSTLSGIQQIANTLNKDSVVSVVLGTKAEEMRQKALSRSAAAERLYNMQKATGVGITGAATGATTLWTKAQWKLNAALAANPLGAIIGIILGVVAAAALLFVGISKLTDAFTGAAHAQGKFRWASKELEKEQAAIGVNAAKRAYEKQKQLKDIAEAEENALAGAKKRNASEIEMAQIKAKYAKENAAIIKKANEEEIEIGKRELELLERKVYEKNREMEAYRNGSKKQKKAREELAEVEQEYYDAMQKRQDLENEMTDAAQAEADALYELAEAKRQMRLNAEQANIDLMREGAAKEIAQINLNYEEQLKALQGNSEEEIALRKALLKKQAKEIADVRKKYALEAQQTAIQEQKNLLAAMSQASGTEADYEEQIKLTKEIAEAEAQAKIDSLDKMTMSEEAYKAEVERIRLELAKTLRDIDEQEVQRLNENAKRKTEIALMEAEAMTRTLNGKESVEEQKAIWQDYYNTRRDQITENEKMEIEAVKRSTDSAEVKKAKITQIEKQAIAEREALKREESEKFIQIDSQYLDELQRNVDKASREADKAQGGSKLQALEERFEAEKALYAAQQQQLDAQYDAGLITYQEYKNQEWEITKATADAEAQYVQDKMQTIADGLTTALGYMQEISDMAFDAITSNIQAELDALDEMYTTDAEEAKKNANKKYITEAEYEKKKAALEMKQAKYAKAQAIINAGINTALAITNALTTSPFPLGIAMAAIAGAMGAAQMAIIASKPLAQYAKGRKGGKGEYALVGEKGPELMYVPQGASIVPNHFLGDMAGWEKFGVPALPNDMATAMMMHSLSIDYDKLGKAVAANIPNQHAVSVNVDRSGVTISDHGNRRTYLNHKYAGSWS